MKKKKRKLSPKGLAAVRRNWKLAVAARVAQMAKMTPEQKTEMSRRAQRGNRRVGTYFDEDGKFIFD